MKNQKLHMLYILPAEGFGGAERQGLMHIKELGNFDIKVSLLTGPGQKLIRQLPSELEQVEILWTEDLPAEYGQPFHPITYAHYLFTTLKRFIRIYRQLLHICQEQRFDLIFGARAVGLILGGITSKQARIPFIWRSGSRLQSPILRKIMRIFFKRYSPNLVVANCQSVLENIQPIIKAPLKLLPNGIDIDAFRSLPQELPEGFVVGIAARPSPDKGMDYLLEVIKALRGQFKPFHFRFAGDFGWRAQIEKQFAEAGVSDCIEFVGHVENMVDFFSNCHVVLLTSRDRSIEGFPNALLEAMACKRPVIATKVGGIPELIHHGETGIMVSPEDPSDAVAALRWLSQDSQACEVLGKNARSYVEKHYDSAFVTAKLNQIIRDVVNHEPET